MDFGSKFKQFWRHLVHEILFNESVWFFVVHLLDGIEDDPQLGLHVQLRGLRVLLINYSVDFSDEIAHDLMRRAADFFR